MSEKFAFQTQIWAFLEGVETKLVLCFENRYDLLWEEIVLVTEQKL